MRNFLFICLLFPFAFHGQVVNVYFASGSFALNQNSMRSLDSLVSKTDTSFSIRVKGFTDTLGSLVSNQKLSEERSGAVYNYLIKKGTKAERIVHEGLCESATGNNLAYNRRVEIEIFLPAILPPVSVVEEVMEQIPPVITIYRGKQGTLLKVPEGAFGSVPNEKVTIDFYEYFNDAICGDCGITTMSTTGQCLQSGGMVFLNARFGGNRIDSLTGDNIAEVWIPTKDYDSSMTLYTAVRMLDGTTAWAPAKAQLRKATDGGDYYVFETRFMGGFNCDRPVPDNAFCSGNDSTYISTGRFSDGRNYVVYRTPRSAFAATRISKNLSSVTSLNEKYGPVVTSTASRKGKKYRAVVELDKLKIKNKGGKKVYKIRRKYYHRVVETGGSTPPCPNF
jgi:hypothetical protein